MGGLSDLSSKADSLSSQEADTQALLDMGFTGTNQNLQTGFNSTANQLDTGLTQTQGLMSDTQSAMLGGQQMLSSDLNNVSGNLDNVAVGLSEGQGDLQSRVGSVQGDLRDLDEQYEQDTTLANQTRADIQTSVNNTGENLQQQLGQFRTAADANQARLMKAVGGSVAAPQEPMNVAQTANQQADAPASPIDAVRTALEQRAGNMAPAMAQQFMEVASAFDDAGNLIRAAQDQNGTSIRREMDRTGQMRVRRISANGQLIGDNVIDARSIFQSAINLT